MKNVVKLHNYYFPGELEHAIVKFVDYYNNERYHESLDNVTPADVYFGRRRLILTVREQVKRETMRIRRMQNRHVSENSGEYELFWVFRTMDSKLPDAHLILFRKFVKLFT